MAMMTQAMGRVTTDAVIEDRVSLMEAAEMLGIHHQSVRRLIIHKVMPATKAFGVWMIRRVNVEMFQANYDPRPGKKPTGMLF